MEESMEYTIGMAKAFSFPFFQCDIAIAIGELFGVNALQYATWTLWTRHLFTLLPIMGSSLEYWRVCNIMDLRTRCLLKLLFVIFRLQLSKLSNAKGPSNPMPLYADPYNISALVSQSSHITILEAPLQCDISFGPIKVRTNINNASRLEQCLA